MGDSTPQVQNPYDSPAPSHESKETNNRRRTRFRWERIGGLGLIGVALLYISLTGLQQLATAGNPNTNQTDIDQLPVVGPIWDFFTPDSGVVVVAKVASNVQSTLLIVGFLAVVFLIGSMWAVVRGVWNPR